MTGQGWLAAVGARSIETGPLIRAGTAKVPPAPGAAVHTRAATKPQGAGPRLAVAQAADGARTNKWIWIR
jgi:hypothetical protein